MNERTPELDRRDDAGRSTPNETDTKDARAGWRRFGAPRAAPPGASRRRDPRMLAPFGVNTTTIDPVADGVTGEAWFHSSDDTVVNVSRRGVCLISETPPSVGTRLLVQFHVPHNARSIDVIGRACWTRVEYRPGKVGGRALCMVGIEIMGGSPAALDRLEWALARLEETAGPSVAGPQGLG